MLCLTEEDFNKSRILVETVMHSGFENAENLIVNSVKDYEGDRKRQFISHLNTLFGDIMLNQLHWRPLWAYDLAHLARVITKRLNEEARQF